MPHSPSPSSSLDPYYFSVHSPSGSPVPPLPTSGTHSKTPESRYAQEPVTPIRDPATIDRRGLHGLGELATPRWTTRLDRNHAFESESQSELDGVQEEGEVHAQEDLDVESPDSPWTIEAIDGEGEEGEEVYIEFIIVEFKSS